MKKINLPIKELNFTFSRSSGAGGQNVNKVNSKVTLHWNIKKNNTFSKFLIERFMIRYNRKVNDLGEVVIISQRFRDQGRNIADCIEKLETMLTEVSTIPKKRKATKPTRSSIEKRLKNKKGHSDKKKMRKKLL